ncbi:unnamed protein product [Rotaria socialis]|uniref:Uncharacterized protein n=1 Tax=Rotaria socialis TaxID=392032 RepID=A0A818NNV3_9BILA|nr:unnamed protein product [Rotaria socialis]CAF3330129.1 unnamed protein product [Rotaria socialis]CAF3361903.1 unnamed protein product [Rotaria socialis]CAF3610482.1 unnamed protein product [Rotaria socialis]
MYRLEQGQSYLSDKQSSLEDRYYNNHSFQEEYRVNDPNINGAATKIQANFRGHQTRRSVEHMQDESKKVIDADRQELGIGREQTETPNDNEYLTDRKSSPLLSNRMGHQAYSNDTHQIQATAEDDDEEREDSPVDEPEEQYQEEDSEIEKQKQEIAARAIQVGYRGSKDRQNSHREQESPGSKLESTQLSDRRTRQEFENERTPTPPSTRFSEKIDSDRQDLGGNLTANDQLETGENDDTDRPRLEREPTQLSEDFERHTQVPRDSDFDRELQPNFKNEDDDMNHSNLDKAATRTHEQHPSSTSPRTHDEYDNTHNKILSPSAEYHPEVDGEDDDNAAATKIQAAYRGYRVRKDLEK